MGMDKMIGGGKRQPDPVCAAAMTAFQQAFINGESEKDANLAAAEAFFRAFAAGDQIPADSPCAAATKAYYAALPSKPSSPNAEAMIAFMDAMIDQGQQRVSDPACADASLAFFKSYRAGEPELTSNFRAAQAFIQQYKRGAKVPTNSPCLISTRIYAANIKNKPSPPNAAAMLRFLDEAIATNFDRVDDVCLISAEAYFDAYLAGKGEAKSKDFDPGSACAKSAEAYMDAVDLQLL